MLKEAGKLSLVLLLCLGVWIGVERSTWPQDFYSNYQADSHNIPTYNASHESHFNPKFFQNATVISNETHMACPEDIAVSSQGVIYAGLIDGSLISVREGSNQVTLLYQHKDAGRIWGIIITSDDSTLYYATEYRGLVKFDLKTNTPEVLLEEVDGKRIKALNGIAIDEQNQLLYMTDAGPIPMPYVFKEMMLAHKAGRVIKFNLRNRFAQTIIDKLSFPNGIVYEAKSNSIIFSELSTHKIWKYNASSGKKTVLIENIFGYADNLKLSHDTGQLLIALVSSRDFLTEFIKDKPALRKLFLFAPEKMVWALFQKTARGIRVDTTTGEVLEHMYGPPTKIRFVSTVLERNNKLYFASLKTPTIVIVDRKGTTQNKIASGNTQRREQL